MKNWLTVHEPHENHPQVDWAIYLQEKYKYLSSQISVGDKVFFYELKASKNPVFKGYKGRMGIIHIGLVTGLPIDIDIDSSKSEYSDGEIKYWTIKIMTDADESKGFVKREALLKLLGYSQHYYFKGFNSGKGIKEISSEMAFELEKMFHVKSGDSIHNSNNKNADR